MSTLAQKTEAVKVNDPSVRWLAIDEMLRSMADDMHFKAGQRCDFLIGVPMEQRIIHATEELERIRAYKGIDDPSVVRREPRLFVGRLLTRLDSHPGTIAEVAKDIGTSKEIALFLIKAAENQIMYRWTVDMASEDRQFASRRISSLHERGFQNRWAFRLGLKGWKPGFGPGLGE
jgi:hypothetical protein